MFLFKVEERFMITGIGLVLYPGLEEKKAHVGDNIEIIRPDKTIIQATIRGVDFSTNRNISVGAHFRKEEIPIGSEVWLNKE